MNERLAIGVLAIIYLVGFLGIGLELYPALVWLTPLNLLISIGTALAFEKLDIKPVLVFCLLVFGIGYGIEVAGIQTGKIFGVYQYGDILGPKLWDTSLMIGVNWVLVTYCTGYSVNALAPRMHGSLKVAIGASMLLILDYIIEPVAIKWGMWTWATEEVPLQNYLAWWIIGLVMMGLFFYTFEQKTNKVAVSVLMLQLIFFGLLNL